MLTYSSLNIFRITLSALVNGPLRKRQFIDGNLFILIEC